MVKVLIIDDDPDIRTVMNVVLKKNGYIVDTAAREEEVFPKVASFKPQVILLDVLLSGADGRMICKQLKEDHATAHIPVIMCSAHPAAGKSNYGAEGFLSKPFSAELLLKTIQKYIPQPDI
jgi:CheY-like chemotaxis protein